MLSLVIPIYNECESLDELLAEIESACTSLGEEWQAIFVDDGSTDQSWQILSGLAEKRDNVTAARLRRNFGKSTALMVGFEIAQGETVVTLDADLQDDPAEIPKLLGQLNGGFDLVSGWKRRRRDPIHKRLPSRVFNWFTARLSGVHLHDFNCGLKAYKAAVTNDLLLYGELYRYIPVIASQGGWRVGEVEVNHRQRRYGKSKFGRERYLRGLFDLFTVLFIGRYQSRPLHLFGGIGLASVLIGAVFCAYLTVLKIEGEAIGRRPLLLLGVLLIVVGLQLLSLGLIGEMIAASRERNARDTQGTVESVTSVESVIR